MSSMSRVAKRKQAFFQQRLALADGVNVDQNLDKAAFFSGVSYKAQPESAIKKIIPGYRPFYVIQNNSNRFFKCIEMNN